MLIDITRTERLLSGSMLFSEAPVDERTYGRLDNVWLDVANIRPIGEVPNAPAALFDYNDPEWEARTGNYSGIDVLGSAQVNTPYRLEATATYSYIVETISGVDGTKQQVTVTSNIWEGERFYIRTAGGGIDITTAEWKELRTFYSQLNEVSTVDTSFVTALTHPLDDDTIETIEYSVAGVETAGAGRGFFGVVVTAENVAGVTTIIGATILYAHKTSGVVNVQATVDGAENVLLQVRGTLANWDWKVEAHFNEVIL